MEVSPGKSRRPLPHVIEHFPYCIIKHSVTCRDFIWKIFGLELLCIMASSLCARSDTRRSLIKVTVPISRLVGTYRMCLLSYLYLTPCPKGIASINKRPSLSLTRRMDNYRRPKWNSLNSFRFPFLMRRRLICDGNSKLRPHTHWVPTYSRIFSIIIASVSFIHWWSAISYDIRYLNQYRF